MSDSNNPKKKKILLVVLPYLVKVGSKKSSKLRSYRAFPYGLLSIATYIKSKARNLADIFIFDCNVYDTKEFMDKFKNKLSVLNPDVVGLSMMFDNSYNQLEIMSKTVKDFNEDILVALGGSAATTSYKAILQEQKYIDAICFHEGEIPLLKLVQSEDIHKLVNNSPAWITEENIAKNIVPQKEYLEDLDDVVDIDYSLINVSNYVIKEAFSPFANKLPYKNQFFLVTSRGCPFNCVFCMHSADKDKSMRYASVDKIISHIRELSEKYNINVLTIYDDQVLFNKKRAKELFRQLKQFNLRIECPNGLSVAYMDDELVGLMKEAGMDSVNLAIESGSRYVLNEIIHKPLKLEMVQPVVDALRKHNFWIQGFFVSGIPGERDTHRKETLDFIKSVGLDWASFSLATPTRGSELFDICMKNDYIKKGVDLSNISELDANEFIIETPEYSSEYVTRETYLMNLDINFVNNYRMKNKEYKIATNAFKDVLARYENHAFANYYTSICLAKLNKKEQSRKYFDSYLEIINKDPAWKDYSDYFSLKYNYDDIMQDANPFVLLQLELENPYS